MSPRTVGDVARPIAIDFDDFVFDFTRTVLLNFEPTRAQK